MSAIQIFIKRESRKNAWLALLGMIVSAILVASGVGAMRDREILASAGHSGITVLLTDHWAVLYGIALILTGSMIFLFSGFALMILINVFAHKHRQEQGSTGVKPF